MHIRLQALNILVATFGENAIHVGRHLHTEIETSKIKYLAYATHSTNVTRSELSDLLVPLAKIGASFNQVYGREEARRPDRGEYRTPKTSTFLDFFSRGNSLQMNLTLRAATSIESVDAVTRTWGTEQCGAEQWLLRK